MTWVHTNSSQFSDHRARWLRRPRVQILLLQEVKLNDFTELNDMFIRQRGHVQAAESF
jgi:hypothetical protein